MSGVPAPQYPIVAPFGTAAVNPADITLPIPVPSQVGVLVGAASFDDGFPPATRTDPELGGVPPYGQDMNGILYMMSVYCAIMQAGQIVPFDAAVVAAPIAGYAIGAKVASVAVPGRVWTNYLDANVNDPDVDPTGWAADDTLYDATAPAAGIINDAGLPGASNYALDIDTTAGDVTYTGFVAQRRSQRLYISNTGANLLTLDAETGSAAGNQIRATPGGLSLVQGQTAALEYIATLNRWLFV